MSPTMRRVAMAAMLLASTPAAAASQASSDLARHDFLYCGEWQNQSLEGQQIEIVRHGEVVWRYTNPVRGEFSDCSMQPNGNVLVARQFGASEITPDHRTAWNYDAPPGTEIHTAFPIGRDRVLIMQNGNPARLLVLRKSDNAVLTELPLPTAGSGTHGQFRHVRPTAAGTFLVAHLDMDKIVEYDSTGKAIWSVPAPGPWAAVRLANGNTLISGNRHGYVREVDRSGRTVWSIERGDLPGIELATVQEVSQLPNGNVLINNWTADRSKDAPTTPALIEVTRDKRVVWSVPVLPQLGPSSSTQILDRPPRWGRIEKR